MTNHKFSQHVEVEYKAVHDLLQPRLALSTVPVGRDTIMLETKFDWVKIVVQYQANNYLIVQLAFEQRPGVWHSMGNFGSDLRVTSFLSEHGLKATSGRIDRYGLIGSPANFAAALVRALA